MKLRPLLAFAVLAAVPIAYAATAPTAGNQSEVYHSAADPAATVTVGNARFTVLTPQLLRIEWAADGKFEDHASFTFLNRRLPVPKFTKALSGNALTLDTADLHLTYDGSGKFSADNLHITLHLNGQDVTWHPGLADTGNLLGTTRTLDTINGNIQRDGKPLPIEPGLLSRDGWTLVDDSTRPLFDSNDFSFSKGEDSVWPWLLQRTAADRQDLYFFGYGHNYKQALSDYVKIAGRIPLPPRFAFGVWWSRYWAYSDQELNELANGYRERNIPLDVFVIDIDWHLRFPDGGNDQSGHSKGWSGYTWNRNLFPEPAKFLQSLQERGMHITLNLHPASGAQPFEEAYPAMARAMGQDPAQQKYVPFDITSKKFTENYFKYLHHPLEKQGVDFWWLDWQQEHNTSIPGVNPTFWLNYVHFTDQEREGKRPLLFHRWGGLGNHRYQIGFSGDTYSSWESLAYQPTFTATAANVGYAYWSHDIGGHMGTPPSPELYTRWIQWGEFSPILRTHTSKSPNEERRVWAYPEPYSDVMADAMRRRSALIPYLYTEAHRTYENGIAALRPLYYDWPEATEAYNAKNEYLFGENLIVAPVTAPADEKTGIATESIWLPQLASGNDWFEVTTGTHLAGNNRADRHFWLQQVPVYMKPGTIIPMQPPMQYTGQKPVDPLILQIAPLTDGQTSTYTLYEDSGKGRDYEHGVYATTEIRATRKGAVTTITVAAAKGSYPDMVKSRAIQVELLGDWPPASVKANGLPLHFVSQEVVNPTVGWRYAGNTLSTVILTPATSTANTTTITVTRDGKLLEETSKLNGFAGSMASLRKAFEEMNPVYPSDPLAYAMQTGNRLSYHPEDAQKEIAAFPEAVAAARASVSKIADQKSHKKPGKSDQAKQAYTENQQRIQRTQAALALLP